MLDFKNKPVYCYVGIAAGVALCVLGLNFFLVPQKIAPGGFSGIGTILYHVWGIPVGTTVLALNIPFCLISWKRMGRQFLARTVFALVLYSVAADLCPVVNLSDDMLLSAVYGGLLLGVGLGLTFFFGGSTGGTDLVAAILHRGMPAVSVSTLMFCIDFAIIGVSAFLFDIRSALFAILSLFISAKLIEYITVGPNRGRAFLIITNQSEAVKRAVMAELRRGVTGLEGVGGYTNEPKQILLCIVERRSEVVRLKELVHREDPLAFMMTWQAGEVNGEGFTYKRR